MTLYISLDTIFQEFWFFRLGPVSQPHQFHHFTPAWNVAPVSEHVRCPKRKHPSSSWSPQIIWPKSVDPTFRHDFTGPHHLTGENPLGIPNTSIFTRFCAVKYKEGDKEMTGGSYASSITADAKKKHSYLKIKRWYFVPLY